MAITLVPKYVRALAEQLNAYYRVLKGVDADSVELRLPGGGRFAVHHSGTNAIVFQVTDAGATGSYAPGDITNPDLADGAVTSAKIADDTIVNADINAAAAIAVTKLAHVGANNVLRSTGGVNVGGQVVSGDIADDTIVNADINSNAQIAVTKLAHVGAGNVLRSTGTQNVGGPLVASDIPNNSITSAKIADDEIVNADINSNAQIAITKVAHVGAGNVLRSNGATNVAGQVASGDITDGAVTSAKIADGTIANADVNAAAAIAITKVADVGAGNVLRSDGAGNVAGKVVSGDIADGTIVNADVNAGAAIGYGKLALGGSIVNADVAAAGTANVAINKLAHVGLNNVLKGGQSGTANVAGQIVNADVAAAADIDGAKLLNGSITASKLGAGITAPATALIATQVLAAPAASITFSGISAAYTHLQIRLYGRSTGATVADSVYVQLNGDTTASYMYQAIVGNGAAATGAEALWGAGGGAGWIGFVPGASAAAASWFGMLTVEIPAYASIAGFKCLTGVGYFGYTVASGNQQTRLHGVMWAPGAQAAISSILLKPTSGSWQTGTVVSLYGLN